MKLDAVGVTAENIAKSVAFYTAIGFTFEEFNDESVHVEAKSEGSIRLMLDKASFMEELLGYKPEPSNHSAFAISFETPEEVNAVVQKLKDLEYEIEKEPWDAFWGQRYAIVKDPDGYLVDLYANII